MESPSCGYKPDSTISDTELERQQQFSSQMSGEYYPSWNNSIMPHPHSPRRQNLDDRINRMLSDSPTPGSSQYPPAADYSQYPQQTVHDNSSYLHPPLIPNNHHHPHHSHHPPHPHNNHHGFPYYPEIYPPNQSNFIQPPTGMTDSRYQQAPMNNVHGQPYEENFNAFASPRNFVNNSNLVEITQQKRERQRVGSNQIAVQVGNVLEIVPSNKMPSPEPVKAPVPKPLTLEELKQQAEKKEQMKNRRKTERERKRMAKYLRKEKLRQEIQKYFDAGISIEDSDDETLIKLRPVNINAVAERGIIKKTKVEEKTATPSAPVAKNNNDSKKVLFKDGVMPGETSSDNELHNDNINEHVRKVKLKRKRMRKKRLNQLMKERRKDVPTTQMQIKVHKLDQLEPPSPPPGSPPVHMKQPRLKNITNDMFAVFGVSYDPIYYHLHKMQMMQNENNFQLQPRMQNDNSRYRYQKYNNIEKHPNNSMQYPPQNYLQQQRYCSTPKPMNSSEYFFVLN